MSTLGNAWGGQAGFVEQVGNPPAFTLLLARNGASISVTWTPQPGATSYALYCGRSPVSLVEMEPSLQVTSIEITGLDAGLDYFVQVVARIAPGRSVASAVTYTGGHPLLTLASVGDGTAGLSWTAVAGVSHYNIYQGTAPGSENFANPLQVPGTSTTVTGLIDGLTYYFVVTAVTGTFESPPSNEVSGTPFIAAPQGVAAQGCSGDIAMSWEAVAGAAGYNVYLGTTPGGESTSPAVSGVTSLSTTVPDLVNGTEYYLTVKTVPAGGGLSAASAEVNATPALLGSASSLTATPQPLGNSILLSWTAGSNASAYNILRGTVSGAETPLAIGVTGTSYSDTTAAVGVLYYYEVLAVNGCGQVAAASNESSASLSEYMAAVLADNPLVYLPLNETSGSGVALNLGSLDVLGNFSANGNVGFGAPTILSDGYPTTAAAFTGDRDYDGGSFLECINEALGTLSPPFALECWVSSGGEGQLWSVTQKQTDGQQQTDNGLSMASGANFFATTVSIGAGYSGGNAYSTVDGCANSGPRLFVTFSMPTAGNILFGVNGCNQFSGASGQALEAGNGLWFGKTYDGGTFDFNWLNATAQHLAVYNTNIDISRHATKYGIGIGGGNGFTQAQNINCMGNFSLSNQNRTATKSVLGSFPFAYMKSLFSIPAALAYAEVACTASGGSSFNGFSAGMTQLYYSDTEHPLGSDDGNAIGYTSSGNLYVAGAPAIGGFPALVAGDVTNWWIDNVAGQAWIGKNNVPLTGDPQAGVAPTFTFTPGANLWYMATALADVGDAATLNLNTTSLVYPSQGRFSPMLP